MNYLVQHFIDPNLLDPALADRTVIEQGDRHVTFSELNQMANEYASYLIGRGVKAGALVGILSCVRPEAIAAMIGCLRAGIVYVPLNIHAPAPWLGNVIRKSNIELVLVEPQHLAKARELVPYGVAERVLLGECPTGFGDVSVAAVRAAPRVTRTALRLMADDLAWVLYTSGSTGDPKGVMITHRNAFTFIDWMGSEFAVGPSDRVFSRAPLQFDLSVFDIFTTIMCKGTLVIAPLGFSNHPHDVVSFMRDSRVTMVYTVPSAYIGMLTKGALDRDVPTLRQLLYAGEPFPSSYLGQVMRCLPNTRVSNIYGPTETNIVLYYHLSQPPAPDEAVPIGVPVHDTEVYIVDENLVEVKPGELGRFSSPVERSSRATSMTRS